MQTTDEQFCADLRDVDGTIPRQASQSFLLNSDTQKRAKLIDQLLSQEAIPAISITTGRHPASEEHQISNNVPGSLLRMGQECLERTSLHMFVYEC